MVRQDYFRRTVGLHPIRAWLIGLTPLVLRLLFFQIAGFFERCKYYAIWTLTEVCVYPLPVSDPYLLSLSSRVLPSSPVSDLQGTMRKAGRFGKVPPTFACSISSLPRISR